MFISAVLPVAVSSGFFADDQAAIRVGAEHDGFTYVGPPITPGFRAIRQPGEAVSVMLVLDELFRSQLPHCAACGPRPAARPGEARIPKNPSRLLASPGTVSSVFPLRGARGLRARPPRQFPR
jgi:hypothetical protein